MVIPFMNLAFGVAFTRPSQDQASQYSTTHGGRAHNFSHLEEELLQAESYRR